MTVTRDGEKLTREDAELLDPEEWRTTFVQMGRKLGVLEWEERHCAECAQARKLVRFVGRPDLGPFDPALLLGLTW